MMDIKRGFPLHLCVNPPRSKFLCSSCQLLLHNPFQTMCGHRFCETCIHLEAVCPLCKETLDKSGIFPDFGIRRDMKKLQVQCLRDCDWIGRFLDYQEHDKSCEKPLRLLKTEGTRSHEIRLQRQGSPQQRPLESDMILASNDGTLIWVIDKFSQLRNEAVSGRKTYLDSLPFLSNRTGYKLQARLYPHGNGYGKGTHMSLFIVILKGPHDDNLEWPFRQKIKVEMLDQSIDNQRHLEDHIYPDPNHPAYGRPVWHCGAAMGLVQFVPLDKLDNPWHKYVVDDSIIIQITAGSKKY